jgi:hypothetical protein
MIMLTVTLASTLSAFFMIVGAFFGWLEKKQSE